MQSSPSSSSTKAIRTHLQAPLLSEMFPTAAALRQNSPVANLEFYTNILISPEFASFINPPSQKFLDEYKVYLLALSEYLVNDVNFHDFNEDQLDIVKKILLEVNETVDEKAISDMSDFPVLIKFNDKYALYSAADTMQFFKASLKLQIIAKEINYPKMIALLITYTTTLGKFNDFNDDNQCERHCDIFIETMAMLEIAAQKQVSELAVMICFCFDLIIQRLDDFLPEWAGQHCAELQENFEEIPMYREYIKRIRNSFPTDTSEDPGEAYEEITTAAVAKLLDAEEMELQEVYDVSFFYPSIKIEDANTRDLLIKLYEKAFIQSLKKSNLQFAMGFYKDILIFKNEKERGFDFKELREDMKQFAQAIKNNFDSKDFGSFYRNVSLFVDIFTYSCKTQVLSLTPEKTSYVKKCLNSFIMLMRIDFAENGESKLYQFFNPQYKLIQDMLESCGVKFDENEFTQIRTIDDDSFTGNAIINTILREMAPLERIDYDEQHPSDIVMARFGKDILGVVKNPEKDETKYVLAESKSSLPSLTRTYTVIYPPQTPVSSIAVHPKSQQCINQVFTNIYNIKIILATPSINLTVKRYALLNNLFEAFRALQYARKSNFIAISYEDRELTEMKEMIIHGGHQIALLETIEETGQKLVDKLPTDLKNLSTTPVSYKTFSDSQRHQLKDAFGIEGKSITESPIYKILLDFHEYKVTPDFEKIKISPDGQAKFKSKMIDIATKKLPEVMNVINQNLQRDSDLGAIEDFNSNSFIELQALKILLIIYGLVSINYKEPETTFDTECFKVTLDSYNDVCEKQVINLETYLNLQTLLEKLNAETSVAAKKKPENESESPIPRRSVRF
jgi:hypothetical protein